MKAMSGGGGSDIEADNDNTGDDKNKRAKENKEKASEESATESSSTSSALTTYATYGAVAAAIQDNIDALGAQAKSLTTVDGWKDLAINTMILFSPQGRKEIALSTARYIASIPDMNSVERAYAITDISFKLGLGIVTAEAGGFALRTARFATYANRVGFAQAAFESRAIGVKSNLFGKEYFTGQRNGYLNRHYIRLGWSYQKSNNTLYFQPRVGFGQTIKHYRPWITLPNPPMK